MSEFVAAASYGIGAGAGCFLGNFQPVQPLSTFEGKSGAGVNGVWRLRVADQASQDVGTLHCWTFELPPIGCFDGGGQCLSPPQLTHDISDLLVTNGQPVQLAVSATGTSPLFYQWYFNGASPLVGQTNASFLLSNATV